MVELQGGQLANVINVLEVRLTRVGDKKIVEKLDRAKKNESIQNWDFQNFTVSQ